MVEAERILIVGAGTMGTGIAALCAKEGHPVTIYMRRKTAEARAATMEKIRGIFEWLAENDLLARERIEPALSLVTISNDLAVAGESTFVIENVAEDLEVKRGLFAELDRVAPLETILATNSSSFNLGSISTEMVHRERLLATHFYHPAYVIPLVEIASSTVTADWAVERASALMTGIGKVVVRCQDRPGYVAVRMQVALVMEAISVLEQGIASAEDIDKAVRHSFGPRLAAMGPLEMADRGGLDVWLKAADFLHGALSHDKFRPPTLLRDKVADGELGVKTGRGLHGDTAPLTAAARDRSLIGLLKHFGLLKEVK